MCAPVCTVCLLNQRSVRSLFQDLCHFLNLALDQCVKQYEPGLIVKCVFHSLYTLSDIRKKLPHLNVIIIFTEASHKLRKFTFALILISWILGQTAVTFRFPLIQSGMYRCHSLHNIRYLGHEIYYIIDHCDYYRNYSCETSGRRVDHCDCSHDNLIKSKRQFGLFKGQALIYTQLKQTRVSKWGKQS